MKMFIYLYVHMIVYFCYLFNINPAVQFEKIREKKGHT